MERYLKQFASIENLEENGELFDGLMNAIKKGEANGVVSEMIAESFWHRSDRDVQTYEDILDSANVLDERIVYDDMTYLLTASKDIITLYEYCHVEDMLGDTLEIGDDVLWADPDDDARDLNRTWEIYEIHSPELIKISSGKVGKKGYSEAEVPPTELVKKSSIIHVEVID